MLRRIGRSLLVILILAAGCGEPEPWHPLGEPVKAPDFTTKTLAGKSVRLSDFKGRVVVLEFWATWCGPCRFSLPSVDLMYRRYADAGLQVLLVNQQERPERVQGWVGERFKAPVVMDPEGEISAKYGVRGLPTLFVVDRQGNIRYAKSGYRGGLEHQLSAVLEELLREPAEQVSGQE